MGRCPGWCPALEHLLRGPGMRYGQASYSGHGDPQEDRRLRYRVLNLNRRPLETAPGAPLSQLFFRPSRNV